MFVKKMFGSFAIVLAILTIPFMYYRFYNHKEPYIPTSVIVNYFSTYDEWDSLVSSLDQIINRTGNWDKMLQYWDEFSENTLVENFLGLGELIINFTYPIIGFFKIIVAIIDFLIGNISWVLGLFEVIRQY